MKKISVLGVGLVGNAIVKDLARDENYQVTAVDVNDTNLKKIEKLQNVKTVKLDLLKNKNIEKAVNNSDLVINAVPGFMGFNTLRTIIENNKNVVDISFFEEDPFQLDPLAKKNEVTAIIDCGVAPGLSNIIAGYVDNLLDRTNSFECYVGGLPVIRELPYEYKAVFSPTDVLQEYIRPARIVENGKLVIKEALSEIENKNFPKVGSLEAFNTDGLRSLAKTLNIPFMKEKTMRYPGHAKIMKLFKECGFFGDSPIEINGKKIKPITFFSKLIIDKWKLKEGEEDFIIMQINIEGIKNNSNVKYQFDLYDEYDKETQTTSMARTTGYTATIIARQFLNGSIQQKGICPPENIGRISGCYENLLEEYTKRDIKISMKRN